MPTPKHTRTPKGASPAQVVEDPRKARRQQLFADIYRSTTEFIQLDKLVFCKPDWPKMLSQLATEAAVRAVKAFDEHA